MYSPSNINPRDSYQYPFKGIIIALTIVGVWFAVTLFALSSEISQLNLAKIITLMGCQTFLYTGLFITGHDAMHGLVCPSCLKINHLIGTSAVLLYAAFPYRKLMERHWKHHRYPATSLDPDFHDENNAGFWAWYSDFLGRYWNWRQFGSLIIVLGLMSYFLHIAWLNLLLFVLVPSLLSSLQLFYFGTFLPHRQPPGGYQYPHCAQSNTLPVVLSFLTCYHFGYHLEHHQYPTTPWWQLPRLKLYGLSK